MSRWKLPCLHLQCPSMFRSQHGHTYHMHAMHHNTHKCPLAVNLIDQEIQYPHNEVESNDALSSHSDSEDMEVPQRTWIEHPHLTGMFKATVLWALSINPLSALPCDSDGNFLQPGVAPPPQEGQILGEWAPFNSEVQFKVADLLYCHTQVSASNIDMLLELWAQSVEDIGASAPFHNHEELYAVIDSLPLGDVPWQCMETQLPEDGDQDTPGWRHTTYEIWYQDPDIVISNMLNNPDFNGQFNMCPYIDLNTDGNRRWSNVMSANIAWWRCVSTGRCCIHRIREGLFLIMLPDLGWNYHDYPKCTGCNVLPNHPWEW